MYIYILCSFLQVNFTYSKDFYRNKKKNIFKVTQPINNMNNKNNNKKTLYNQL